MKKNILQILVVAIMVIIPATLANVISRCCFQSSVLSYVLVILASLSVEIILYLIISAKKNKEKNKND